ncbi:MAG: NAD(P)/FAD-dependent oxidoreductase [Anaerolineae bacterium]|nr:NAD(P)/FAD-dependent oxidoreductase [Anaerolineae bacterium]
MNLDYDVIVVGGRVAGSSTALLLARLGYRVLIIDRSHPGKDTLSTHAIMRSGVLQLQRWGVLQRILDQGTPAIRRIVLGFGEQEIGFDFREAFGVAALYAPRRYILDTELLAAAVEAGAEFRQGYRLLDLLFDEEGRVTGVQVNANGTPSVLRARFVVGADGMRSRVAAAVKAPAYERHPAVSSYTYGYFAGIASGSYDAYFVPGLAAGFIPTNEGLTAVFTARPNTGNLINDDEFYRLAAAASPNMATHLQTAELVSPFYRTLGIPGFLRVPGGPGWALVGDAGFTKDPVSAHGISDALRDAELLANALDAVLAERTSEWEALNSYHLTRDRFALPQHRATRTLAEYGWDEAEASALMRRLGQLTEEECDFHLTSMPSATNLQSDPMAMSFA